ncbi:putative nuclease HARBI1 [Melitaea cinxia]|uniref:putative nuclease HARBI1 n=1 Tax=Melitaea cinxia TaxID=113334 RepID=UPI001E270C46|nr:putative nuclease HARBI1 [Melitaea cinxia]
MVRPSENEERYYCRKGNHARNIQLITDADLNILHVDATYGGATHDSFIFNHSIIQSHLEGLVNAGETVHLLGDSGYAQRAYLMVPVPNIEQGTPAAHYNKLHATARNTVERTIGRLKGRFRYETETSS